MENDTPENYKWTALSVASLGMLVGILNASTLIIALPTMMVKLNTDLFGIMWVLISYTLLITILAPAWGRLADIYHDEVAAFEHLLVADGRFQVLAVVVDPVE